MARERRLRPTGPRPRRFSVTFFSGIRYSPLRCFGFSCSRKGRTPPHPIPGVPFYITVAVKCRPLHILRLAGGPPCRIGKEKWQGKVDYRAKRERRGAGQRNASNWLIARSLQRVRPIHRTDGISPAGGRYARRCGVHCGSSLPAVDRSDASEFWLRIVAESRTLCRVLHESATLSG